MENNIIEADNIGKAYDGNIVLDIPSLHIKSGESFGLVGNNGAGKTTLMSLMLDLIKASRGKISIKGKDVSTTEEWKKYLGSFLDETFLIDFMTPDEYFIFVGKLYGWNKSQTESFVAQYDSFFNGEIIGKKKYIRDLSKGNQKKTGLIAALIGDPEIILLDEPFANLDPTSQIKLKNIIAELSDQKTVLVSSHDLQHITGVCERIVVLEKGKLVKDIQTNEATLKELENYFAV